MKRPMIIELLFVRELKDGVDCFGLGIDFDGPVDQLVPFPRERALDLLERITPHCAGHVDAGFEFLGICNVYFSGAPMGHGFTLHSRNFEWTGASHPSKVRKPFRLVKNGEHIGARGSCLELRYYFAAWPRDGQPRVMHCVVHGPSEAADWPQERLKQALARPHASAFLPFPAATSDAVLLPRIHVHEVVPMGPSAPPEVVAWQSWFYDSRAQAEELILDGEEVLDDARYLESEVMRLSAADEGLADAAR